MLYNGYERIIRIICTIRIICLGNFIMDMNARNNCEYKCNNHKVEAT